VEGTWFDGPVLPWVQFSPDAGHLAYWVRTGDKLRAMVDGKEVGESEALGHLVFSADGRRTAYTATRSRIKGTMVAVVDGAAQKEYGNLGVPVFSPDGRHVAYAASIGTARILVVDGRETLNDRGFEQLLGIDQVTLAYDLDTGTGLQFRHPVGFAFDGPHAINALARKGVDIYRVRIEIADTGPGATGPPR
jgi:hypothetical protein